MWLNRRASLRNKYMGNKPSTLSTKAIERSSIDASTSKHEQLDHFYLLVSQFVNKKFKEAVERVFKKREINIINDISFNKKINTKNQSNYGILSSNTMKKIQKQLNLNNDQTNYLIHLIQIAQQTMSKNTMCIISTNGILQIIYTMMKNLFEYAVPVKQPNKFTKYNKLIFSL